MAHLSSVDIRLLITRAWSAITGAPGATFFTPSLIIACANTVAVVDSLICVKSKGLPRFSYFDRYLSEEERDDAMTARVDIYDLQWRRIEILKIMGRIGPLRKALEDYTDIIGYNQDAAKDMLKQLNGE